MLKHRLPCRRIIRTMLIERAAAGAEATPILTFPEAAKRLFAPARFKREAESAFLSRAICWRRRILPKRFLFSRRK